MRLRGVVGSIAFCRSRLSTVLMACGLSLLVIGCDGAHSTATVVLDGSPDVSTIEAGISDSSTPHRSDVVSMPVDSTRGGVFLMPVRERLIPDPAHADRPESLMLISEVFSGLMRFVDEEDATMVVEDLAERYTILEGGSTYEFVLKPGLKFSDGTAVTAGDFKWSWERALRLSSDVSQRAASVLGVIAGADDVIDGETEELAGVEVIDDRTMRVMLESPRSDFLMRLSDPTAVVLSKANVRRWGADFDRVKRSFDPDDAPWHLDELPIGTGPFKLTEFDFWERVCVISRNEHYAHGAVHLDGVAFVSDLAEASRLVGPNTYEIDQVTDLSLKFDALENGKVNVFETYLDARLYRRNPVELHWRYEEHRTGFVNRFLVFNNATAPFDDIRFRRALTAAFDPTLFSSLLGDPVATSIAPSDMVPRNDPDVVFSRSDESVAQSELAASTYSDVASVELNYNRTFEDEHFGFEAVFKVWEIALGISTEITGLTNTYYSRLRDGGKLGMVYVEASPKYPDPGEFFGLFVGLFGDEPPSPEYARVEEWVISAESESDRGKRRDIYARLEDYLRDEALALPVHWDTGSVGLVLSGWVNDYRVPRYHGTRFADVWFDLSHPSYPGS